MANTTSALTIGVLFIPIDYSKATKEVRTHFNLICKDSKEKVRNKRYCPSCNKEISSDDIIKGYEFAKGQYVTFTAEELDMLKSNKDKTLHVEYFCKASELDPIYYNESYYVLPSPGAEYSYELMRQALLSEKLIGIAKTVMNTRETLNALFPTKQGIILRTLHYQNELKAIPTASYSGKVNKTELETARTMLKAMTKKLDISAFRDEYEEKLENAVMAKVEGKEIVRQVEPQLNNVINIQDGMRQNIEKFSDKKAIL